MANQDKLSMDYEFPQINLSENEEDDDIAAVTSNKQTLNPMITNELINLESFNLDTHLDLKRYMYFNQHHRVSYPNMKLRILIRDVNDILKVSKISTS